MKISELMQGKTPSAEYKGILVTDDYVLAINTKPSTDARGVPTPDNDYEVLEVGIKGYPMALNPKEKTRQFIRTGEQTVVTSKQTSFNVTGARYVGDPAQDFILAVKRLFAVGQDVITDYIYFDMKTGTGFKGKVSIIVNSIAEGEAGDDAGFSVALKATEVKAAEWEYSAA